MMFDGNEFITPVDLNCREEKWKLFWTEIDAAIVPAVAEEIIKHLRSFEKLPQPDLVTNKQILPVEELSEGGKFECQVIEFECPH